MISIRYPRTKKHKTSTKKWKLLCQLMAIWYATTITTSFIDGSTGAYFNDQDHVTGVITAGTWSIWDKSSLTFPDKEDRTVSACSPVDISVRIMNTGSTMEGNTEFAVYYADAGNPKDGSSVFHGDIEPIKEAETTTLQANINQSGNYKFKALQRPGHSNKEDIRQELWSETITVKCDQKEPEKAGDDPNPDTPGKKEKDNQEVNVPAPTTKPNEKNNEEKATPKEEDEPEQPAVPAELEMKTEEQAEVEAASEQSQEPPKKEETAESTPSPAETTSTQE
ncbi:amyloid fiber anchoring/assembly protein TapA [Rossellomorea sp. YZS02]|uniref:amyloid fiber anchoring/assembly protein TapA n=1 Tax=Rossellomorea sp. YZS02 TaxID=3097358 RepID=UPI002A0DCCEA|nr:amyloid fiber anchoring/assembly protein TapA [Rossellomorea sp. YZS02]MDX8346136.1 amyloid fiber anchoring/assembly protein TapA [Rossellomorea sp. YZS02]